MSGRPVPNEIKEKVRALLDANALSQVEIAFACGVSQGYVSLMKRGYLERKRHWAAQAADFLVDAPPSEKQAAINRLAEVLHDHKNSSPAQHAEEEGRAGVQPPSVED